MMYTDELYKDPCQKIDPWCIDAFFDLKLTPAGSAELTLDNSWGSTSLDITPAVKAAETVTSLQLTPTALQYNSENYGKAGVANGGVDCINGDDLSHIISMKYLKDVAQTGIGDGDIYIYNEADNLFETFDFNSWRQQVNTALGNQSDSITQIQDGLTNLNQTVQNNFTELDGKITALQQTVNQLQSDFNTFKTATTNRLDAIEATIAKPSYVPQGAKLAWGTTNTAQNSAPTTQGIWTHNPNSNVTGDTRFN